MMNDGVKMNILDILMNTVFTPFAEFDYDTYAGASDAAKIGEYKDMVVVVDGHNIEVFDLVNLAVIYAGYMTKDGLGIREHDASGHKRS
jgi:hypothetical protein